MAEAGYEDDILYADIDPNEVAKTRRALPVVATADSGQCRVVFRLPAPVAAPAKEVDVLLADAPLNQLFLTFHNFFGRSDE